MTIKKQFSVVITITPEEDTPRDERESADDVRTNIGGILETELAEVIEDLIRDNVDGWEVQEVTVTT